MSDVFDDVRKWCIDNSRSVKELDKYYISTCMGHSLTTFTIVTVKTAIVSH